MKLFKWKGWIHACVLFITLGLAACVGGGSPGVLVQFPAPSSEVVVLIVKYKAMSSYHGSARAALDCYLKEYRRGVGSVQVDYSEARSDVFYNVFVLSAEYYPLMLDSRGSLKSGRQVPEKMDGADKRDVVSRNMYAIESLPDLHMSLTSCGDIKSDAIARLATRYQARFGYFDNLNVLALKFRDEQ